MTYAVFKAAGFQYRAELGDLRAAGQPVTFDEVLLGSAEDEILVGRPTLEGAAVRAEVLGHGRADKIIVFKFKRRKNYRRKTGHRQNYTEIRVSEIDLGGGRQVSLEAAKKAAPKKEPEAKAEVETAAKPTKKPAAKKPAAKKPAAKKPAAKKPAKKPAAKKTAAKAKTAAKPKAKSTTKKTTAKAKTTTKSKKKKS